MLRSSTALRAMCVYSLWIFFSLNAEICFEEKEGLIFQIYLSSECPASSVEKVCGADKWREIPHQPALCPSSHAETWRWYAPSRWSVSAFNWWLLHMTYLKTAGLFRVVLRQSSLNKELEMSKIKSVIWYRYGCQGQQYLAFKGQVLEGKLTFLLRDPTYFLFQRWDSPQ